MTKRTEKLKKQNEDMEMKETEQSETSEVTTYVDVGKPVMRKRISRKLIFPAKKKKVTDSQETEKKLEKFNERLKEVENDVPEEDKFECPSCFEVIKRPFPKPVETEVRRFNNNEKKHRSEQIKQHKAELKLSKQADQGGFEKPLFIKKLEIPEETAKMFCQLHRLEMKMRPLSEEKGYPMKIRFDRLKGRVKRMEKDLLDVIHSKTESGFFNDIKHVYKEQGSNKARATFSLMSRFDKSLPGYYGPRGSVVLIELLGNLFMETGVLTKEYTKPLQPIEYLQQVLVPECAVRLIQEDLQILKRPNSRDNAMSVMKDSIEFGTVVHSEKQD